MSKAEETAMARLNMNVKPETKRKLRELAEADGSNMTEFLEKSIEQAYALSKFQK